MTELRHYDHDGRARFVTFSTHKRLPILISNRFRLFVTGAIASARVRHGFSLLAYVIMPEHVHLVLLPRTDSEVGRVIGEIKQESARSIAAVLREKQSLLLSKLEVTRDGEERLAIWQRRCFDHNCREEPDVWENVNYCHGNPVKRGLVAERAQWRFSSYGAYIGLTDVPLKIDMPISDEISHPSGGAPFAHLTRKLGLSN